MRRLFADHAYSDDRISDSFWAETVPESALKREALTGQHKADVAVIGAGFTGLSAALSLARAGANVTVVEAAYPGWGASGRNGGFCCLGGAKASDAQIDRAHGKAARLEYRQAEVAAVDHVAATLTKHKINAETHSKGETLLSHKAGLDLSKEIPGIEENYGVTPEFHEAHELEGLGMTGPFHGALTTPIGFGLNPRAYLFGLLRAAEAAGAKVFGATPVLNIQRNARFELQTPQACLQADQIILATNGYSSEDIPDWLAAHYMPSQSSVLVTRELSDAEIASGWSSDQMSYDSRILLHYFRLMPNRRFLFGMRGGLMSSARSEARIKRKIRKDFEHMFPAWAHVETPYYWSGMVCLSAGLTPVASKISDLPGAYAGFAYHGNGVAMGSYTGALLADQILGKNEKQTPEIMRKPPKKFPLGRARRALMWAIYAGAALKDR